jgi:hypothetical protein
MVSGSGMTPVSLWADRRRVKPNSALDAFDGPPTLG